MFKHKSVDTFFIISVALLIITGTLIFVSASFGLIAREADIVSSVTFNQLFLGLGLGLVATFIMSHVDYLFLRKHAFYIFLFSIIINLLLIIPGLAVSHGGATRWLNLGPLSFQPSEILKIGFIIYLAAWLSGMKDKIQTMKFGLIPLLILIGITGVLLLAQPDTDTFAIICVAGLSMYFVAKGPLRDIGIIFLIGLVCLGILAFARPYVFARITTFLNPEENALTSGYQIQQSLIAIGSGKFSGRGFGQSIQKFNFLPEPIGDSIFAVLGEEFGFIGTTTLIFLFIFFLVRSLKIASRTHNTFGRLVVVGIAILITVQAFQNMSAMLGLLPLSGIPLPFVSHGGTALLFTLLEIGIIANISRHSHI